MNEDVIHLTMGLLMTAGGLIVSLLVWNAKSLVQRVDRAEARVSDHATEIEVLRRSTLAQRVDDHESRLKAVEAGLSEIKSDVRLCVQGIEHVREFLESGRRKG